MNIDKGTIMGTQLVLLGGLVLAGYGAKKLIRHRIMKELELVEDDIVEIPDIPEELTRPVLNENMKARMEELREKWKLLRFVAMKEKLNLGLEKAENHNKVIEARLRAQMD